MNNKFELSSDADENTKNLLSIPGLDSTVAVSVGNAIFLPRQPGEEELPYVSCKLDIDNNPFILVTVSGQKMESGRNVYPVQTFNMQGIRHIFRHGGIPTEMKKYVFLLALSRKDESILSLAFDKEEIKCLKY